jgi:ligand-binding sensor domain-containing protein
MNHIVKLCKILLLAAGLLSDSLPISASDSIGKTTIPFQQLYLKDGLASDWVFDITEDSLGFIWFAGHTGLSRWDGSQFKNYFSRPGEEGTLTENQVFRVYPFSRDFLWCSTIGGGLNILDIKKESFSKIEFKGENLPETEFISGGIKVNDSTYYYLLGRDRNLARIVKSHSGKYFITSFPLAAQSDVMYFQENKARYILPDPKDSQILWIIGNFRIYRFDRRTDQLELYEEFRQVMNKSLRHEQLYAVFWLDDDRLFLSIPTMGFYAYNLRNRELEFIADDPSKGSFISRCAPSKNGHYWMGNGKGQLFKYHPESNRTTRILFPQWYDGSRFVESIFECSRGRLFVGIPGKGVLLYDPNKNLFNTAALSDFKGHSENYILNGILHPDLLHFYFRANPSQQIQKADLANHDIVPVLDDHLTKHNRFAALNYWRDSEIITHDGKNLFALNTRTDQLRKQVFNEFEVLEPMEERRIKNLFVGDENELLLIGEDYFFLKRADSTHQYLKIKDPAIFPTGIRSAVIEGHRILALEMQQLIVWDLETNQISRKSLKSDDLSSRVVDFREIVKSGGNYFIGCVYSGIFKISFSETGQSLELLKWYNFPETLISNNIYALSVDHKENIWASTGLGIQIISASGENSIAFGHNQNLPQLFIDRKVVFNQSGLMATATHDHLIYMDLDLVSSETAETNVFFHSIVINNEKQNRGLLKPGEETINLKAKENNLKLSWSVITNLPDEFYILKYSFPPFIDEWVEVDNTNQLSLANIPPGTYQFLLRKENLITENAFQDFPLNISIAKPFLATYWFRGGVLLLIILIVYLYHRQKLNRIKKEEKLKTDFNKQLAEMELNHLRSQMNPHFMFNSLNSIKLFILKNEKEKAAEYLSSFSQLIRDILNYSKLNYIPLWDEIKTLKTYIELERMRFRKGFDFELDIDPNIDLVQTMVPPMILQPFVENAIWHGLMHKENDRKLKIIFTLEDTELLCQIIDNGIGREKAAQIKSKSAARKSHGINITQSRLKQIRKKYSLEIEDLYAATGEAAGTAVCLQIPYKIESETIE